MKIEVFRPKQFADMKRDYKLYADEEEVAIIKRGETQIVDIPDSATTLQARIDWCSSPKVNMSEIEAGTITVKNAFSGNLLKMLITIYYVSFGKDKYLTIEKNI
jgi:hypothetical protein